MRHPQSDGVLERLHRMHRSEGPFGEDPGSYAAAVAEMERHVDFHRNHRPHTTLKYLPPAVWHFGNPAEKTAQPQRWLAQATAMRRQYWTSAKGAGFHLILE